MLSDISRSKLILENAPEKLYIIAHNTREDIPNTRVKDFYDIYKLFGKNYDEDKFSLYFEAMVMMYGMNLDDINADFLDKEFVKRHLELWEMIKEKDSKEFLLNLIITGISVVPAST